MSRNRLQLRRGLAATWTERNPVLLAGELGLELDTNQFKIGDGETAWNALPYYTASASLDNITEFELTSVQTGDVLRYSSGKWRNYPEQEVVNGGDF
jgi:hypothetical protein